MVGGSKMVKPACERRWPVEKFKRRRSDASRLTLSEQKEFLRAMSTPAAVEPPTPENVHLYRAATLAWRGLT